MTKLIAELEKLMDDDVEKTAKILNGWMLEVTPNGALSGTSKTAIILGIVSLEVAKRVSNHLSSNEKEHLIREIISIAPTEKPTIKKIANELKDMLT